jgi:ElaB/YqjD/DUF883 family membrane-anchored ribosome-binding protein
MADETESTLRDAAGKVADKVRDAAEKGGETFRKTADKVNQSAKEGIKTAQQFADTAQKYVQDSGLADLDLRDFVSREPWIALGVAFAVGYVAAQVLRRVSSSS